nr:hypothetical protein [Tanacetum cinerariifolium]
GAVRKSNAVGWACGIELAKELLLTDCTGANAGTLENLIMWARNQKYYATTFHCAVRMDKIRTKRGWNYPSCGAEKCKKGNLDRIHGRFWCDLCHSSVDYPVLELDEEETALPSVLANIVGTEALDESGSSVTLAAADGPKTGVFVPLTTTSLVTTPSKPGEQQKPRSEERHDSDKEESFVVDSKIKGSDVGCSSEASKRRRYVRLISYTNGFTCVIISGWCWIARNEYHKFGQYVSAIKEAARVPTISKFNVVMVLNK